MSSGIDNKVIQHNTLNSIYLSSLVYFTFKASLTFCYFFSKSSHQRRKCNCYQQTRIRIWNAYSISFAPSITDILSRRYWLENICLEKNRNFVIISKQIVLKTINDATQISSSKDEWKLFIWISVSQFCLFSCIVFVLRLHYKVDG